MKSIRVLFIEPYPTEGPSSRYRVEQFIPYLKQHGIVCLVRPFVSSEFYRILYKKGYYFRKTLFFLESSVKRFFDIFRAIRYDIIFVHLEAFPFGMPIIELIFSRLMRKKIIYDLDDAIYMGVTSKVNSFLKLLKCPSKIKTIISMSRHVITCNQYLAEYARKYNKEVTVVHTSIDTEKFKPREDRNSKDIIIGWIGSHSTAPYLDELKPVFKKLSEKHEFVLKIIGASGYNLDIPGLAVMNLEWQLDDEINQFQSLDIGVYPLPDNKWTLGKTGFKTIQYMSVGVPCVVSDVGSNREIVKDGVNGYLIKTKEEWVDKISMLIKDSLLRKKIGHEGRLTAKTRFSLKANAPKILEIIKNINEI